MTDVLIVISGLKVGGTERQVALLAEGLVRAGNAVTIYSLMGGEMHAEFARIGVELVLAPGRLDPSKSSRLTRALYMPLAAFDLFRLMRRRRPQVVHFFLPAAYLAGAPAAVLAHVPVRVMSRRSLNVYQNWLARVAERVLHLRMHAVLGNSASVIAELKGEGVPAERLALIYNGLADAAFAPPEPAAARQGLGLPPGALVMSIVANLIAYKGHQDLINALAIAAPDLPPDWRLLVVGRDDGIGVQLQAQAKRLGLAAHIEFLGARNDVPAILAASDIGLLCSHEEGFSNAILEGMAAGLPMIVTDVGGNREAVIDGETGLVVPARDPARLAAAIVRLAHNADLRARLGAAARERAAARFSLQSFVQSHQALYAALIDGRRPCDVAGIRIAD
jgi:glycosyltransferase involved in cell wall biosynthesis